MPSECPQPDGSSPRKTSFDAPMPMCIDPAHEYRAEILTSMGAMSAFLYPGKAPNTVNNFVCLARYHYYDNLVFHRVIQGFMIQGGCPEGSGRGGPGYRFADELPTPGAYQLGSLAMANAGPNTNGSQFFIVSGPSGVSLPPQYSLFGQLISGMDVLDSIEKVATGPQDRPVEPVTIERVVIEESMGQA